MPNLALVLVCVLDLPEGSREYMLYLPLYNGVARALHCRGRGTCGSCAVRIEGEVSEPTSTENLRLTFGGRVGVIAARSQAKSQRED